MESVADKEDGNPKRSKQIPLDFLGVASTFKPSQHKWVRTKSMSCFQARTSWGQDKQQQSHITERFCPSAKRQQQHQHASQELSQENVEEEEWPGNMQEQSGDNEQEDEAEEHYNLYEIYEKIRKLAMMDCAWSDIKYKLGQFEPLFRVKRVTSGAAPPPCKTFVKESPFLRHQMYQRKWKQQPAVGEVFHYQVAHDIRKKMKQKYEPKMPHKLFIPNLFEVPTLKPRQELRISVRKCNKNFVMPPTGIYHDVVNFG